MMYRGRRDLNPRSPLTAKFKTSEDLYFSVVKTMAEGVVIQDTDGIILTCNESAEEILGLSYDQIIGRASVDPRWYTVREDGSPYPGEEHPAMVALRTGKAQTNVIMGVHRPNGVLRWLSINCELMWNSDSIEANGVITTFSDVTERKFAEEQTRLVQVLALEIGKVRDFSSALETVLRTVCETRGFAIGEAWTPCSHENILKYNSCWSPNLNVEDENRVRRFSEFKKLSEWTTFALGRGLPGRVWLSKAPEWQTDVSQLSKDIFPRTQIAQNFGIRAALSVPILAGQDVIAVLVFFKDEAATRDDLLVESLVTVSAQLSFMLQRRQIEDAVRDNEQLLRLAIEGSGDGLWHWNIATGDFYLSPQWLQMLDYEVGELPSTLSTWEQLMHPEDRSWVMVRLDAHLGDVSVPYRFEYRLLTKTGDWKWIANYGKVVDWDEAGKPLLMAGIHRDINRLKQAKLALKQSESELRALFEAMHDLVVVRDIEGRCLKILSSRSENLLKPIEEMIDKTLQETFPEEQAEILLNGIRQSLEIRQTVTCDYSLKMGDENHWFSTNISPLSTETVALVVRNISDRKKLEQELFQEKELAQVTLHSIGDGVITTDADRKIRYFNPVAEALTGWNPQQTYGLPLVEVFKIIHEVTREPIENPIEKALDEGQIVGLANHALLISRDGREIPIEDSAAPIRDRNGEIIGAVLVFHDVTHTRSLTRELSWQATHDSLTELFNRQEFERCVELALKNAQSQDEYHALCYLDLDQFKIVNDTCGHAAGDELLRQVAMLVQPQIRKADTLARLGGDEFGILLHQCPLPEALRVANKIRECVQAFRFTWRDQTFKIGVSIGLVAITANSESLASILSAADAACYTAKNKGRNRVYIFQTDDRELLQQRGEMQWVSRITQALEEDRFCLYYQTITAISPQSEQGEHYEVLLRLRDNEGNLVPPMAFIPAAERYGLMHLIDRWVIDYLFKSQGDHYRAIWHQSQVLGKPCDSLYSINLSGASLNDDEFIDFLHDRFERHNIPPQLICFEITETQAISNLKKTNQFIQQLQKLGCQFALDDFGSGMSSFAYLKNLSVDYLKIDGAFIRNIVAEPVDEAMVVAMTQIGHVMNIKVVAEFVENDRILARLKSIGIDYAQGYGIAQPRLLCNSILNNEF